MERNYAIDTLRTVATFLVILLHVSGNYVLEYDFFHASYWVANVIDSFTRISVPLFVLISGMFLVGRQESLKKSYSKRASRILWPLILWTVVYLIFSGIFQYFAHDSIDYETILLSVIYGKPYYHMWYMYMLLGLYIFVPILNYTIVHVSRKTLWIATLFFLAFGMLNYSYDFYVGNETLFFLWFVNYLGYFILGFLLKDSSRNISAFILITTYIMASSINAVLSYITMKYFDNSYFYGNLSPLVILGAVCIFKIFQQTDLKRPNILSKISYLTLGIYLAHAGILVAFDSGMKILGMDALNDPIYGIPIKFVIVLTISIGVAYIFHSSRYLNKFI